VCQDTAIFYAAEIIVALADLHARKIVYRDLKPENIMITKDGHVKICDFGFAKFVLDRTWTLCGTPESLAPEVIQGEGHNQAADWWSLGVLIYELLAGFPPFYDPNPIRIYDQVLSGVVRFPAEFGPITRSLLSGLLTLNKSRRLGNLAGASSDVMNHEFFRHVNWDAVRRKQLTAPWKPPVKHSGDTAMFQMWQNPQAASDPMVVGDARFATRYLFRV
jgi:protein kinase X